jgi:hypothetical protein
MNCSILAIGREPITDDNGLMTNDPYGYLLRRRYAYAFGTLCAYASCLGRETLLMPTATLRVSEAPPQEAQHWTH